MKWLGPTWVTVDLDALQHNLNQVKKHSSAPICAVVKGDAYGHGIRRVSQLFASQVNYLAVNDLTEALEIRTVNNQIPILVLCPPLPQQLKAFALHNLTVTINSQNLVEALAKQSRQMQKIIKVHLKIDTGMNRLGISPNEAIDFVNLIKRQPFLKLEGIYTHFAAANNNLAYTRKQLIKFKQLQQAISEKGHSNLIWHCANSAALINLPETHLDLVRVGTLLYGQSTTKLPDSWNLQPTWNLFSRIIQVKKIAKGESIGYGLTYTLKRPSVIGVIPIGYSDGLGVDVKKHHLIHRLLEKPINVLIHDQEYPVIGKIAMGMCCIDLTDHPKALDLYGTAVCIPTKRVLINQRLPKVYFQNKKVSCVYFQNHLWEAVEKNGQLYLKDNLNGR